MALYKHKELRRMDTVTSYYRCIEPTFIFHESIITEFHCYRSEKFFENFIAKSFSFAAVTEQIETNYYMLIAAICFNISLYK